MKGWYFVKRLVKVVFLISFITLISLVPYAAQVNAQTGGLKYTVTVTKFENRAGWNGQWDIGDGWGLVMTDILNQTGRFIVLGESDMRVASLGEQDLAAAAVLANRVRLCREAHVTGFRSGQKGPAGGASSRGPCPAFLAWATWLTPARTAACH